MQDLTFRNQFPGNTTYPGVRTALGLDRQPKGSTNLTLGSDVTYSQWNGVFGYEPSPNNVDDETRPKKIYRGSARERTLRICGWGSDHSELKKFLNELEQRGEYSRAAAIAIFCLQIRLASQILQRGGEKHSQDLSVFAIALSGFSEERSGALWREMVTSSCKNMSDPYLKAMFAFLLAVSGPSGGGSSLESVLLEPIKVSDKVAFCCLHLPDSKLIQFVNDSWKQVMDSVDLSGFYLCGGSSHESVALLQRVVDQTGDVQIASWMAVKTLTVDLAKSEIPQQWIRSYKSLLDSWRLFKARAELDDAISRAGISSNSEYQVTLS